MSAEPKESVTATFTPIITALLKSEDILGQDRLWAPQNPDQQRFLRRYFPLGGQLAEYLASHPEGPTSLKSIASFSADEINRFLEEHRFNIRLNPFTGQGDLGTASVMDTFVKWHDPGRSTTLRAEDGNTYSAARLGDNTVIITERANSPYPLVSVLTEDLNHLVHMMTTDQEITDPFQLLDVIESLEGPAAFNHQYEGVIFPKVDLDVQPDISWLLGMSTIGKDTKPAIISQALQQTKFKMNEIGAHARSAAAIGMTRGGHIPKEPYVIDRPFVCWLGPKRDLSLPLFAAYINYSDWKDPGSLEM